MRWRLTNGFVLLALAAVPAAHARSVFYLTGAADAPLVYGRSFLAASPGPNLTVNSSAQHHGLEVSAYFPDESYSLYATFLPPEGELFAPGVYHGVAGGSGSDTTPGVRIATSSFSEPIDATLTVHDAAYEVAGSLVRFVADFSQVTEAGRPPVVGAIQLNAGDGACAGAPDGTACDDADACTATASCVSGTCTPGTRTACGPAPDGCHDTPVCNPFDGVCGIAGQKFDQFRCDDGNACTTYDYCQQGVCVPLIVDFCSDHDACTYAHCDAAAGCRYPAIPGICDAPGIASSFVFVQATGLQWEDDFALLIQPPDLPSIQPNPYTGGLDLSFDGSTPIMSYGAYLSFHAPEGEALVPGTYENASPEEARPPGTPALIGQLLACEQPELRRFVLHEIAHEVHADTDRIVGFAVDVTSRCPVDGGELRIVVRYRAGDATCDAALEGTPCDDRNACTLASTCQGGLCVGGDPVVCPVPPDGCHAAGLCDPSSGACLAPSPLPDDTACRDSSRCIRDGRCVVGVCTTTDTPCEDYDVCTRDVCDGDDGCTHPPIDGTCWELKGTATVVATAFGATCACTARATPSPIALLSDGTFARPGGLLQCSVTSVVPVPAEVGTAKPSKRGRLKLRTTNLADVRSPFMACGSSMLVRDRSGWVKVHPSRSRLHGLQVEHVRVQESPLRLTTTVRFRGSPTTDGTVNGSSSPIERCGERLVDCLNEKLRD